jgi:tRNA A37 threonylcarbamoyladenosine biosynthesis protein TsaE
MQILDHFQHINLTKGQSEAIEKLYNFLLSDERIFILQGYAGSGKTTLLKGVVQYLKSIEKTYQLMAPTGRAAKVINQKTGFVSTTVHKGIYSFEELQEIERSSEERDVSFLYQYKLRNNTEMNDAICIVDEASMVSDILSEGEFFRFGSGYLLKDLIAFSRVQDPSANSKIIFIGDPAQLPPIGMNFSPALDAMYLEEIYQLKASMAEMKEVKRQDANNGILQSATKLRQCLTSGYFNDFNLKENKKDLFNPLYENYLETYKAQRNKKIIICYKNKTALDLNRAIRNDKFGSDIPIQPTDIVIIGNNNYRLEIMNGEFAVIAEANSAVESREIRFRAKDGKTEAVRLTWRKVVLVVPNENGIPKNVSGYILENYLYGDNYLKPEEQRALYVDFKMRYPGLKKGTEEFKEAISNDPYFNCIQLKYGYAVTCHKAQGGEWENAFVFWDRGISSNFNFYETEHDRSGKTNSDFYRWAYTAITRASKRLYCINPPFFSSFSGMTFIDANVQKVFNELTGVSSESVEIDLKDEVLHEIEKFGLLKAPLEIQDHFIGRWYSLKEQNIQIIQWERVGYEIRYVFKRANETAAFKFWVNGKNVFKSNYQKLPAETNSQELYSLISNVFEGLGDVVINRNTAEAILDKITFDIELEENKPFLKNLFDIITHELKAEEVISKIAHLSYRERYTIQQGPNTCVIDFEYNKDGFFGRVLPIDNKCNSVRLLDSIKDIINKLKATNYAI